MSDAVDVETAGLRHETSNTLLLATETEEADAMLGPPVAQTHSAPLPTGDGRCRTLEFDTADGESKHTEDFADNGYMHIRKKGMGDDLVRQAKRARLFSASSGRLSYPAIAVIGVLAAMLACTALIVRAFGPWGSKGDHSNIVDKQLVGTVVSHGFLVNKLSGKCIDVQTILGFGPGKFNDMPLEINFCQFHSSETPQMWELTDGGFIRSVMSGKCIKPLEASLLADLKNKAGAKFKQWHLEHWHLEHSLDFMQKLSIPLVLSDCEYYNPNTDQTWSLLANGYLQNRKSGKCLDVYGAGYKAGSPLHLMDCGAKGDQQWSFTIAEEGVANSAYIRTPACNWEVPTIGFPAQTAALSNSAWPSGTQPPSLACWPQTQDGSILPCDTGSFQVLDDTASGWPGKCSGLGIRHLLATEDSYGFNCQKSCETDPECSVWQLGTSGECFQGFGSDCYADNLVKPVPDARQDWFHRMETRVEQDVAKEINTVAHEVEHPFGIKAAQRLQHGYVRVLMNTKGMEIVGLSVFKDFPGNDQAQAIQQCRLACYSYVLCQFWQFAQGSGCFLENPKDGHATEYPLTMATARRDTPFAQSVIDGEYIQHLCHKPLATSTSTTLETSTLATSTSTLVTSTLATSTSTLATSTTTLATSSSTTRLATSTSTTTLATSNTMPPVVVVTLSPPAPATAAPPAPATSTVADMTAAPTFAPASAGFNIAVPTPAPTSAPTPAPTEAPALSSDEWVSVTFAPA
mmetsp:Transcript_63210/g.116397  ORF Transcript_63210/g.116397 Transcript_63210/m.116397 type:complete len:744 (+) Transcript_63210:750-2981(+)